MAYLRHLSAPQRHDSSLADSGAAVVANEGSTSIERSGSSRSSTTPTADPLGFGSPSEISTQADGRTRARAIQLGNLTNLAAARVTPRETVNRANNPEDYYRFTLTRAGRMRFELRNLTANANLALLDASGRTITTGTVRTGTGVDWIVRWLRPGTWYVRVNAVAAGTIGYALRYHNEDGRTRARAIQLGNLTNLAAARVTPRGTVNRAGNPRDYYRFALTRSGRMRFELRNLTANANLALLDASGRTVTTGTVRTGTGIDSIVRWLRPGTWYVRVNAVAGGTIGYALRYHNEDGRTRARAIQLGNLTHLAAARVTPRGTVNRAGNPRDYYRFALTRSGRMRFELRNLTANANLALLDASGRAVTIGTVRTGTGVDSIVRWLRAGTYYVRVNAVAAGTIGYALRYHNEDGRTRARAIQLGNLTNLAAARVTPRGTVNRIGNAKDYYSFTLANARTMRFELRSLSANADLFLENASGRQLGASRNARTAVDSVVHSLDAGTYYIRVDAIESGTIRYQLRYSHDDGSTPRTATNLGNLANVVATRTRSGTVNRHSNDKDYYRFTLSHARRMRFELRNLTADADLYLEDASGRQLRGSDSAGTAPDSIIASLAAGTYYLRVDASESGTIRYQLRYAHDRGSTPRTALNLGNLTNLAMAGTRSGRVDGNDTLESNDDNYYRFTLTAARAMRFELRSLTANADLYLEDASGRQLYSSENAGTAVDSILVSLNPGTWYVRVDANASGTIRYQLHYARGEGGSTRLSAVNLGDLTNAAGVGSQSGTVDSTGDRYYRFTLTVPREIRIELRDLTANADLYLEDAAGRRLHASENSRVAVDSILAPLNAGTYYIRVEASDNASIGYQLRYAREEGSTPLSAFNLGDLTNLAAAGTRSGTVDSDNDDYYRFTLTDARAIRIELRNLTANADLYLEDASGRQLHASASAGTATESILAPLNAGTWYIRVEAADNAAIGYQLRYVRDEGSTRQSAFDLGDLTNIAAAGTRSGAVETGDDDYYRFTLAAARVMRIELRNLTANADLYLEDAAGRQIRSSTNARIAVDSLLVPLNAGTWYIRVNASESGNIGYQLRYSRDEGSTPQSAIDLGDLTSAAGVGTRSGTVNRDGNEKDYFRFTLTAAQGMRIELRDLTANADLYLEDAAGRQLHSSVNSGTSVDWHLASLAAGTYYIRVNASDSGTIDYQLRYARDTGWSKETAIDLGDLTNASAVRTRSGAVDSVINQRDYYRFTLSGDGGPMWFGVLSGGNYSHDVRVDVLYESGGRVRDYSPSPQDIGGTFFSPGTYYVRVSYSSHSSGTRGYQLHYAQNRHVADVDGGTTFAAAANLGELSETPTRIGGYLPTEFDEYKYYRFTLSAASTVLLWSPFGGNWSFGLYNSSRQRITRSQASNSRASRLDAGTYYIRIGESIRGILFGLTLVRLTDAATSTSLTTPPMASLTSTPQSLWHDDAIAAARALQPDEKRHLQGTGGMLSA